MVQSFCDQLHQAPNPGNLTLKTGSQLIEIRLGTTANDIDEAEHAYQKAKITFRERLPRDLRASLEAKNYFRVLQKYLNRKPLSKMTLTEFNNDHFNRNLAASIWDSSFREASTSRMEKQHPGFANLKWVPRQLAQKAARTTLELGEEVAVALWEKHPNWQRTVATFNHARKVLIEVIEKDLELDEAVKKRWVKKLNSVELYIPGTLSLLQGTGAECASTQKNAYYSGVLNKITVCAGYFNTHDITATLTHELSHALDPGNAIYDLLTASKAGQSMVNLRETTCARNKPNCEAWSGWKKSFRESLSELGEFEPVPLKFAQCLQRKADLKAIDMAFLEKSSKSAAVKEASDMARRNEFLEMAKEELILPDGSKTENPGYLNPCGMIAPRIPVSTFSTAYETFFVNELQCSTESSAAKRLDQAIASAKELVAEQLAAERRFGGKFSKSEWMMYEKYALPVGEQFADILGMYAYAKILKAADSVEKRRHLFFSSQSTHCPPQSLSKLYPEEYEAQKKHSSIKHSKFYQRFEESLTREVREALGCKKDFEREECQLDSAK